MSAEILLPASDEQAIARAVSVLQRGGLVVFPTDTVYGVGASVDSPEGVARLYVAKGRPLDRPIPVLVSSPEAVNRLATSVDDASKALMERYWPGSLTIILPAQSWLPDEIVRGTGTVGLRMPDHALALDLIDRSGGALATTSANRSDEPETRTAGDAAAALGDSVDIVLDGGVAPGGVASTVVRVDETGKLHILRHGAISAEELEQTIERPR